MALISQIKVGDTTYDVAMKAGNGIYITRSGVVSVKVASGLKATEEGIMLLVSGHDKGYNRGLTLDKGVLDLKIGSGLRFKEDGTLDLA